MIAKNPINPATIDPVENPIDLSAATVELPPDDMPELAKPVVTRGMALATEMRKRIEQMRERAERAEAEVAYLKEPGAEHFETMREAAIQSGVSRSTLERWVKAGLVHHYRDPQGVLWIDVNDAILKRFKFARSREHK
jgi:hypothetical protein